MRRIGTCKVMLVSFVIVISTAILCVSVDADGHQEHLVVIEPSEGISTDDPLGFILEFEAISAELDRYPDHAFVLCVPPLYGDDLYDIVVEAIGQEHFISESSLEESDLGPWINVTVSGPPGPDGRSIDLGFLEEEFEGSNVTFTMDYFQNGPAISEAFASGEVDGAADQLAKFTSLIDAGEVAVFADGTESETCQISAFVGRNEFCEQYPEITAKILRAVQRVDEWMAESEENQQEAFTTLSEITQREVEWFSTMYYGSNFGIDLTEQDLRVLSEVLEFMKDNDLLSNPDITMDDVLELSYLELAGFR